jgi:16S rRNA processing protein RimM
MTEVQEGSLVWIGRVVKTQGIKGEIKVTSSEVETTAFAKGNKVYLENIDGTKQILTIRSSRRHQGQFAILALQEVQGPEEAQKLVGCSVFVAKENLAKLSPNEFYWYQLKGLQVRTTEGNFLGIIEEIFPTGSNDVFVVRKKGTEILIPATEDVVVEIDLQERVMKINPVEGLLAENDL